MVPIDFTYTTSALMVRIYSSTRSQAVARISDRIASQHVGVTWRHRTRDHL